MSFLRDLIRWFFGKTPKNEPSFQPISQTLSSSPVVETVQPKREDMSLESLIRNAPQSFLNDLQSIRPFTQQFEKAREDLLHELQKLAPPRKRRFKNAA